MRDEAGRSVLSWWVGLVIMSGCLMGLDRLGWNRGVQGAAEVVVVPVKQIIWSQLAAVENKTRWWRYWQRDEEELARLRNILENQAVLTADIGELKEENENLRTLIRAKIPEGKRVLPAKVIGRKDNILVLNQGEDDGLRVGQMVVSVPASGEANLGSLVGRVEQVNPKQARVAMVVGNEMRIPVIIRDSVSAEQKGQGILVTKMGELVVDKLLPQEEINVGNVVATGGAGEETVAAWVPGIAIGVVTKVRFEKETDVYQQAEVSWLARDKILKYVFVVVD